MSAYYVYLLFNDACIVSLFIKKLLAPVICLFMAIVSLSFSFFLFIIIFLLFLSRVMSRDTHEILHCGAEYFNDWIRRQINKVNHSININLS